MGASTQLKARFSFPQLGEEALFVNKAAPPSRECERWPVLAIVLALLQVITQK